MCISRNPGFVKIEGRAIILEGDFATCPSCGRQGVIVCHGPRHPRDKINDRHKILEGDVFDDGYGNTTVGLGHKLTPADHLHMGDTISIERARAFARADLSVVEEAINEKIKVPLYQHEYDALVSMLFNSGIERGKHEKSRRIDQVALIVNKGVYSNTPEFMRHFVAHRLPFRRAREAEMFSQGVYNASH